MVFKITNFGAALLMVAPLVAVTSCIIKEDCVYTPKVGHPWRVTITATVKVDGQPDTVDGARGQPGNSRTWAGGWGRGGARAPWRRRAMSWGSSTTSRTRMRPPHLRQKGHVDSEDPGD